LVETLVEPLVETLRAGGQRLELVVENVEALAGRRILHRER
jgi:hypothetical protein